MDNNRLEIDETMVTPGQVLTTDMSFMRGHGTYLEDDKLIASVAGRVERVNKLISVRPLKTRFNGEVGDVVVGRILEQGTRRWKVDIKGRQTAVLQLSAINLPGGVQRRKTESDELEMSKFFKEGDLLSAEVQAFYQDGSCAIHTRGTKYKKLRNGSLVVVPAALVKRSKSHFITLPQGVDVILGLNGYIWVSKHSPFGVDTLDDLYSSKNDFISVEERNRIAKVCNVIKALAAQKQLIEENMIIFMLEASSEYTATQIMDAKIQKIVVEAALNSAEELMTR